MQSIRSLASVPLCTLEGGGKYLQHASYAGACDCVLLAYHTYGRTSEEFVQTCIVQGARRKMPSTLEDPCPGVRGHSHPFGGRIRVRFLVYS